MVRDWLPRTIEQELIFCQRYYEKTYAIDTVVGSVTNTGRTGFLTAVNWANSDGLAIICFKVQKRVAPTISLWDPAGNSGKIYSYPGGTETPNVTPTGGAINIGDYGFLMDHAENTNRGFTFHYAATAEL